LLQQAASSSVRVLILPASLPGDASAEIITARLSALVSDGALDSMLPGLDSAAGLQSVTPMEPCGSDLSGYCPVDTAPADSSSDGGRSFFDRVGLPVLIVVLVGIVLVIAAVVGGVCYCLRNRSQADLARIRAVQSEHGSSGKGGNGGVFGSPMSSAFEDNRAGEFTTNPAMEMYAVQSSPGSESERINQYTHSEAF